MAELAVETVRLPLRRARRDGLGHAAPSASWCGSGCASAPATRARARPRRWSPTTACRWRRCWPRSTPTPRCSRAPGRRTTRAALLEACRAERPLPQALAAIDLALWDRAGRRAGRPVAALLGGDAAEPVAVNALVGAEDRAGAAARRRRGGRGGLPLREGQGRDRRRRRPARRGARRGRARTWRSAPTPTAPGARRARRSPTCARSRRSGSSCARSRCTALEALREVRAESPCRSRSTRARPSRARRARARPTRSA